MRFSQNSSPMMMATDPSSGFLVALPMSWSPKILMMPSSAPPTSADCRTADHGSETPDHRDDDRVAPQPDPVRDPVGCGTDDAGQHRGEEERRAERHEDAEVAQLVGQQVAGRPLRAEAGPDPVAERPDPTDAGEHQADQGDDPADGQQRELRCLERDEALGVRRRLDEPGQRLVQGVADAVEQLRMTVQDEPEDDRGDGERREDREEGVVGDPRGEKVPADLVVPLVRAVGLEGLDLLPELLHPSASPAMSPSGNSRTGTHVPPPSLT